MRNTKEEVMSVESGWYRWYAEVANEVLEGKVSQLQDQILRNLVQYKRMKI